MTLVIACPTCTQKVRVPKTILGRQVKCPQCKNGFIATDPNAAPSAPTWQPVQLDPAPPPPPEAVTRQAPPSSGFGEITQFEDDPAPAPRYSRAPQSSGGSKFTEYLLFRRMITPTLIIVVFYFMCVVSILGALFQTVIGIMQMTQKGGFLLGFLTVIFSLIGIPISILFWRIFSEVLIAIFRILDNLREINEKTTPPS